MRLLKIFQPDACLFRISAYTSVTALCALAMLPATELPGQRGSKSCDKRGCPPISTARSKRAVASFDDPEAQQMYLSLGIGLIPLHVKNRGSTIPPPFGRSTGLHAQRLFFDWCLGRASIPENPA